MGNLASAAILMLTRFTRCHVLGATVRAQDGALNDTLAMLRRSCGTPGSLLWAMRPCWTPQTLSTAWAQTMLLRVCQML
jgi:hypothetical protein